MNESIYNNTGDENRQEERSNQPRRIPKNIKQVGESNSSKKIYIEDYVVTYIKELASKEYTGLKIAVLLGDCIKEKDSKNIFIYGAVEVNGISLETDTVFSNDSWTSIYEDIHKYFHDIKIVGWYLGGPSFLLEDEERIKKIHVDNFAGADKTLLRYDSLENEEEFYIYEHNQLKQQSGYYIYYERNEEMQNYMVDHKQGEVVPDHIKESKVIQGIKNEIKDQRVNENNKNIRHLLYAAGTLVAVIMIVIGATIINNTDSIKDLQKQMKYMSGNMVASDDEAGDQAGEEADGKTIEVETIGGQMSNGKLEDVVGDKDKDLEVSDSDEDSAESGEKEDDSTEAGEDENDSTSEANKDNQGNQTNQATQNDTTENDANSEEVASDINYVKYTIQQGETLAAICRKLYSSTEYISLILEVNEIEDQDTIFYGQDIMVPEY